MPIFVDETSDIGKATVADGVDVLGAIKLNP